MLMQKLGGHGHFFFFWLVGEYIHTKLWISVPWHVVGLGNQDDVTAVRHRCTCIG